MQHALTGKRILITHSTEFMGPVLCQVFTEQGADVVANPERLTDPDAAARVVAGAGQIDILVANLAFTAPTTAATDVSDTEWRQVFAALVDPLPRLLAAVLPAMMSRKAGKVLLIGSASALRGMKRASTYSAARGAQLAYVQAVGVEVAPYNVQVNAIAQNFVENQLTSPPKCRRIPGFRSACDAKSRLVALWRHVKMPNSRPTCAATQQTASLARSFRYAAAGLRDNYPDTHRKAATVGHASCQTLNPPKIAHVQVKLPGTSSRY